MSFISPVKSHEAIALSQPLDPKTKKIKEISHVKKATAFSPPSLLKVAFIGALLLFTPTVAAAKPLFPHKFDFPEQLSQNPMCPAQSFAEVCPSAPQNPFLPKCDISEALPAWDPGYGICQVPTVDVFTEADCSEIEPKGPSDAPLLLNGTSFTDCRSFPRKISDTLQSGVKEGWFITRVALNRLADKLGFANDYIVPSSKDNHWKPGNEGLYVLIHGLDGHPSQWDGHARALKENHPKAEIRQPYVPEKGELSLQDAAKPITAMIRDYIDSNPGKPVTLLGVSNGGRIASYIESELRDVPSTIHVSNIAGVHFGTKVLTWLNDWGLYGMKSQPVHEEFPYGSKVAQKLLDAQRTPLEKSVERDFDFYATTEDILLQPYSVALPRLGQGERHYIVHSEGHSSIIDRVRDHQLGHAIDWMKSHQPHSGK